MNNSSFLIPVLIIIIAILFLSGCAKSDNNTAGDTTLSVNTPIEKETTAEIKLPEGVYLTNLFASRQGSMRNPYYILTSTHEETYMKMTYTYPPDLAPSSYAPEDIENYFVFSDSIQDDEYALLFPIHKEGLEKAESIIEKYGALGWDGFNESESLSGVLDADMSYDLYIKLSDGTSIEAFGYNVCPLGMDELIFEIEKLAEQYMPKDSDFY